MPFRLSFGTNQLPDVAGLSDAATTRQYGAFRYSMHQIKVEQLTRRRHRRIFIRHHEVDQGIEGVVSLGLRVTDGRVQKWIAVANQDL